MIWQAIFGKLQTFCWPKLHAIKTERNLFIVLYTVSIMIKRISFIGVFLLKNFWCYRLKVVPFSAGLFKTKLKNIFIFHHIQEKIKVQSQERPIKNTPLWKMNMLWQKQFPLGIASGTTLLQCKVAYTLYFQATFNNSLCR